MFESTLRYFSVIASVLIIAGWLAFAIDQTRDGSDASQQAIAGQVTTLAPSDAKVHHGVVRSKLDSADDALLSPFRGIISPGAGDWVRHSIPALIALLLYGFGVSYLARFTRGRA